MPKHKDEKKKDKYSKQGSIQTHQEQKVDDSRVDTGSSSSTIPERAPADHNESSAVRKK